jgi:hypothetical protein
MAEIYAARLEKLAEKWKKNDYMDSNTARKSKFVNILSAINFCFAYLL